MVDIAGMPISDGRYRLNTCRYYRVSQGYVISLLTTIQQGCRQHGAAEGGVRKQ